MKINNRLKIIAGYINDNSKVLDVGCDHALLDIYLVMNKKNISAIASDIRKGPLEQANKNIEHYKLNDKIITKLGDGISTIENDIDTIVISGLGGSTIKNIIYSDIDKLKNINRIVLSPNNDFYKVRKYITKLGYIIEKEELFSDKGITYLIISFIKGKKKYSKKELMFGVLINKDSIYKDYYKEIKKSQALKLTNIPKKYIFKRIKIKNYIKQLNRI